MSFERSDILKFLKTRSSTSPKNMGNACPSEEEMAHVFEAAMSAPDHGAIRPWRFLTIQGKARERLADIFVDATRHRMGELDVEQEALIRSKPLRAPLIVAVVAEVMENHPKVPRVEQIVATACAAEQMLLALEGLGYGGILLTGPNAHDPFVRKALGFAEKDELVGFIYIGNQLEPVREKRRPDHRNHVCAWTG